MNFKMTHQFMTFLEPEYFDEHTAPDWLTCATAVKGSTMDSSWFWRDHVLTLEVGKTVETDFRIIERLGDNR